jgi:hypothetical protein
LADRIFTVLTCFLLVAAAGNAIAMELDTLLPTDIPGYGGPPITSVLDRPHPEYTPIGLDTGDVSLAPKIDAGAGYDSDPNGAGASSGAFTFNPSITAVDTVVGFGVYAAGNYTEYPGASDQNLSGYTIALGEHAVLARETLDIAAAWLAAQETGFGLNTVAVTNPVSVTVQDAHGSDAVVCGMVTLTPEISFTKYQFTDYANQNRTDYRQSLTSEISPGGPARFVTLLHATESEYLDPAFNANTYSALAGVADEATGVWNIRLLAGAATRQPETGDSITAPVLEAAISWMPTKLDSLTFDLAREIDDPDQESAAGYTLSEADISIAHEYLRNVMITGSFNFQHAAYFSSPLIESLYSANAAINWHLNRALALSATYAFNDRQANFLKAANQNSFILGITWSP